MTNIVLDTNSLIMAISARNIYHKIWLSFLEGDYCLCISNEILEEYAEVISNNINPDVARYVIYYCCPLKFQKDKNTCPQCQ